MTPEPISAQAVLTAGLEKLSLPDAPHLSERLLLFGRLLLEANRTTNLVGADSIEQLVTQHFLDSLAPLAERRFRPPIIDVGSGAGFPGIPVALAFPRAAVTLLEPRRLRAEFLRTAVEALGLERVTVVKMSAESAGRSAERREQAATVLIRAIGKPAIAVELGLPLLKHGGELWLYRGRDAEPDEPIIELATLLGGELASAKKLTVPFLDAQRHLWIFRKVRATPEGYPRRSGIPGHSPLSAV